MEFRNIISSRAAMAGMVALAAISLYLPALSGGVVWDDLNMFRGASEYLPFFENAYHRPFYDVSMALDSRLWGENAVGFHMTSVLLHAANSALVFILGLLLLEKVLPSLFASLLFALQPVNTEAVAWVSARSGLLMTFFFLAAFILYLRYLKEEKASALAASALFFLLSALSGQAALVFPAVVLSYELTAGAEERHWKKLLPYAGALGAALALYLFFFRGHGEFLPAGGFAPKQLFHALSALGYYLVKLAIPVRLNFLPEVSPGIHYVVIALMPLGIAAALYSRNRSQMVFLTAWVLISLLPPLLIVMAGVEHPVGERFLYLPSAGFCLILASALGGVKNRKVLAAFSVPLLLLYAYGTFERVQTWKAPAALWEDTARKTQNRSLVHINHGAALIDSGMYEEGEAALKKALLDNEITPEELAQAMKLFGKAGEEDTEAVMFEALKNTRGKAEAYFGMGFTYYELSPGAENRREMLRKAADYLERAVAEDENFMHPHYYLGLCYLRLQDWKKAEEHLKIARELDIDGMYRAQTKDFLRLIDTLRERGLLGEEM